MHLGNPLYILFCKICSSYIVSLQKRKPPVVIFKINCIAHTVRILIDKAKYALISAASFLIHKKSIEFKSDVVILRFSYFNVKKLRSAVNFQYNLFFGYSESVVKNITDIESVNRYKYVVRLNSRALRGRSGFNLGYFNHNNSP